MAKQLSLHYKKEDLPRVLDCLRYEEIQDLWRTTLPRDEDIDWCAAHVRNCGTGAHALTRRRAEPWAVFSALNALEKAENSDVERCDGVRVDVDSKSDDLAQQAKDLLGYAGAVERGRYDYALPCGQHGDTHINTAKLCWSESVMARMASLIGRMLDSLQFDTLVSTCWPMATIARRFLRATHRRLEHVRAEGYPPTFLGPIQPGSQVVILTDVVVSGQLTRHIQAEVQKREGRVVKCIALAAPEAVSASIVNNIATLCRIPMKLEDPEICPRCDVLPLMEFNALASHMTLRKERPRSPSQFLSEDKEAAEFWGLVERTGAYERHHRNGPRHYVAFVDTLKLLSHPGIGELLARRLCELVLKRTTPPEVVLAPNRARARLLAQMLLNAIKLVTSEARPQLILTRRRGQVRALPDGVTLKGRSVLVLDAAADHGDTIDELTLLASEAGGSRIAAAVLLSRLRAGSAEALDARLGGGFVKLFSLPIPGFRNRCLVCDRYDSWRESTYDLPPGPARDLVLRLTQRAIRRTPKLVGATAQLPLFAEQPMPPEDLLARCHRRVAGGIALHALHAARGDGMAPLSIAEVFDERIPLNNRIGLVEALPSGILVRTETGVRQELERYLHVGEDARLWIEVADVFVREGRSEWVDGLGHALRRQAPWISQEKFWARLSAVSLQARQHPQSETQTRLEALAREFEATPVEGRLRELSTIARP